jgi:hypothetical protein
VTFFCAHTGKYDLKSCLCGVPGGAPKILLAIANDWLSAGLNDNGNLMLTYAADRYGHGSTPRLGTAPIGGTGNPHLVNRGKWIPAEARREPNRYRLPWIAGRRADEGVFGIRSRGSETGGIEGEAQDPPARKMRAIRAGRNPAIEQKAGRYEHSDIR